MPSSTLYAVLLALVLGVGCGESKKEKAAEAKAEAETCSESVRETREFVFSGGIMVRTAGLEPATPSV